MDLTVLEYTLIAASFATISFIAVLAYKSRSSVIFEQDIKELIDKCILLPGQDGHTSDVRETARNLNSKLRASKRTARGRK